MKGYKVFHPNWTCLGFKYEIGKIYELKGELEICKNGFHFCEKLATCFNYYPFNPKNKIAEIEALGEIKKTQNNQRYITKYCTDKIKIVKEITWSEALDIMNCGSLNTGIDNQGSGNCGNKNFGNANKGDYNKGDYNIGNGNIGFNNKGDFNRGNYNIGRGNHGCSNIGFLNKGNNTIGCFNTQPTTIYMFNKPTDWTIDKLMKSKAFYIMSYLMNPQTKWVYGSSSCGLDGCLKTIPHNKAMTTYGFIITNQEVWDKLFFKNEKDEILSLPNFDPDIFYEITGVRVDKEAQNDK